MLVYKRTLFAKRTAQTYNPSLRCVYYACPLLLIHNGIFTAGMKAEATLLYFSNISNIQYYNETGNNTRVVFDNLRYGEALECNLCDHKIYWIDLPGMIKRGNPNDPTSVETVSP